MWVFMFSHIIFQNHTSATVGGRSLFTNRYFLQGPANKNVDYFSMQCFFFPNELRFQPGDWCVAVLYESIREYEASLTVWNNVILCNRQWQKSKTIFQNNNIPLYTLRTRMKQRSTRKKSCMKSSLWILEPTCHFGGTMRCINFGRIKFVTATIHYCYYFSPKCLWDQTVEDSVFLNICLLHVTDIVWILTVTFGSWLAVDWIGSNPTNRV